VTKGRKIKVAILFGGQSAEHEVSLQSAGNVAAAIDRKKYDVVLIGIDKKGRWYLNEESKFLLQADSPKLIKLQKAGDSLALVPGDQSGQLISLSDNRPVGPIDVVFPVLHGPFGEDGTVQGLLKLANVPFVGAGVLGSAVGMDKDVMKRLLRDAGIPVANFLVLNRFSQDEIDFDTVTSSLGTPVFVKPTNLGSSVGISKAQCEEEFREAINLAFQYDNKIMVEEYIEGREIECSVLGNDDPIASLPGEIVLQREFYSYEAKYIDEDGAVLEIPAKLDDKVTKKVQDYAIKTFKAICCEGMARVDFFLSQTGDVVVNEINTIPGFTNISMYPKLWEASGIGYSELIDRLIQLAIERFNRERQLRTDAFESRA
jgi:D-alanine-D-alanine ligase